MDAGNELDPSDAKKISSFLFPEEALYPSGTATRKGLIKLLSLPSKEPEPDHATESEPEGKEGSVGKHDDDQLCRSLGDFRELNISQWPKIRGNKSSAREKEGFRTKNIQTSRRRAPRTTHCTTIQRL